MAILCYEITGSSQPNARSTTGAEDGHIGAVLKGDHQEASAQLYSVLAANRLAMFLGIPVIVGVPARRGSDDVAMRFAALRSTGQSRLTRPGHAKNRDTEHCGSWTPS